jgi:hypothetical protein
MGSNRKWRVRLRANGQRAGSVSDRTDVKRMTKRNCRDVRDDRDAQLRNLSISRFWRASCRDLFVLRVRQVCRRRQLKKWRTRHLAQPAVGELKLVNWVNSAKAAKHSSWPCSISWSLFLMVASGHIDRQRDDNGATHFVVVLPRLLSFFMAEFCRGTLVSKAHFWRQNSPVRGGGGAATSCGCRIFDFGLVAMTLLLGGDGRCPGARDQRSHLRGERDHRSRLYGLVRAKKNGPWEVLLASLVGRGELPTARSSRLEPAGINPAARWRFCGA